MDSEWGFKVKWEKKAYEVREAYTTYHYPSFSPLHSLLDTNVNEDIPSRKRYSFNNKYQLNCE